jgi:hypothetical protein
VSLIHAIAAKIGEPPLATNTHGGAPREKEKEALRGPLLRTNNKQLPACSRIFLWLAGKKVGISAFIIVL